MLADALQQQFIRSHALRAADDLAVAFRRQHVYAQRQLSTLGVRLHVKRFYLRRIAMHHDRPVELRGKISLVRRAQVATPLELVIERALRVPLLQPLYRFVISDARKRRLHIFQLADIAPDGGQLVAAALQAALDDKADEVFRQLHDVVERSVGDFRLHHPEFCEVPAGLGFFRAKSWAEGINLAQRHSSGFDIELSGLREIRLLIEILDREQRAGALAGGGRQYGRIGEGEAAIIKKIAGRLDDFRAHPQNRRLARGAHPQMAVFHQELDSVFLQRNGIRLAVGHALHHFRLRHIQLVAARGALIGADFASNDDARFLRKIFYLLKDFQRHGVCSDHALHQSTAVAKDGEEQLAAFAQVIEPSADSNAFADMAAELADSGNSGVSG